MNIETAKHIKLQDFLQSLGYTPIKISGEKLYYKSPFRNETQASFKVNTKLNLWYDFGLGKGGSIIALAEELYHSRDISYLLAQIAKATPGISVTSYHSYQPIKVTAPEEPAFKDIEVCELSHPALLRYLTERKVDIAIAQKECVELHFTYKDIHHYLVKSASYAKAWAIQRANAGKKASLMDGVTHALGCFIKMYLLKAGFLDGKQGFLLAILSAHSTFVKYADLWNRTRNND